MKRVNWCAAAVGLGMMLGVGATAEAGVFWVEHFTGDSDSQISSAKTYTHAVNLAASSSVTVNGVVFSPGQRDEPSLNYTLVSSGAEPLTMTNNSTNAGKVAGESSKFFTDFFYNSVTQTLTLTGLTPGQTYRAVFYAISWGGFGGRYSTVTDSLGGSILYDQNMHPNGGLLIDEYTPTSSTVTFTFTQNRADSNPGDPNKTDQYSHYHFYAFSNEVVPEPAAAGLAGLGAASALLMRRRPRMA